MIRATLNLLALQVTPISPFILTQQPRYPVGRHTLEVYTERVITVGQTVMIFD